MGGVLHRKSWSCKKRKNVAEPLPHSRSPVRSPIEALAAEKLHINKHLLHPKDTLPRVRSTTELLQRSRFSVCST